MFDSLRFLLLSTLISSISFGAPLDVKQGGDAGKEKSGLLEEKGEKGGYEPPPPVVTEHTLTLADGKVLKPMRRAEAVFGRIEGRCFGHAPLALRAMPSNRSNMRSRQT